jgi:cytochrome b6-f complex iron-sulfur subunit
VESSALLAVAIAVLLFLAAVMVIATGRRQATTGHLDRDARRRDESASHAVERLPVITRPERDLDAEARARAEEAREALEPAPERVPAVRQPVDEEELGITRRQFFNRGILASLGLGVSGFGVASLAFLWPSGRGGFGAKVHVGSIADIEAAFDDREPFYNASAKTYIVPYPNADVSKAEDVYQPAIVAGMEEGYVALYQKCPHLGCRVPWCESSQWFECPCHGSKYNRVGEKRGGPAPRGMDRFALTVSGGGIEVDTGTVFEGPPIGTDTTGQSAAGAPCV